MTTTALMPVDPSVSPQQAARILTIRADLLPPEIRDSRRATRTRSLIIFLLVATLAVLGGWYWQATVAKEAADQDYNETFKTLSDVRDDQKTEKLTALVQYQTGGKALNAELTTVLAKDLSWTNLINLVGDRADDTKVSLSDFSASLSDANSGGTTVDEHAIGTLTISGMAENKKVVADFVNKLGDLEDLTNPFVTSVTNVSAKSAGVSFTLSVTITDKAYCGRFAKGCPSGGK